MYQSNSQYTTRQIGETLASQAKKGDIYALVGPMGAGKTVFAQGFAKGLQIEEDIISPTYAIAHEYPMDGFNFHHFDVYRIGDERDMEDTGIFDFFRTDDIILIEWADKIKELLPPETIWIYVDIIDENNRHIEVRETMRGIK